MRDEQAAHRRLLSWSGCRDRRGAARVMGSSVPASAVPSSPAGRSGAGRVESAGQAAGRGGTVESGEGDPGRAERGGGFGGPAVESARRRRCLDGLAQHDQHFAAQQVPAVRRGRPGRRRGRGPPLPGRGGEAGGGVEQRVDGRGEVDRLGPHQDLGRLVERVEPAGEPGDQRFLLGRGAQAEGDRAGPADHGQPVDAEVDDPVGADTRRTAGAAAPVPAQAERRGRPGAAGTPSGAGTRRCGAAVVAPAPSSPTGRPLCLRTVRAPASRPPPRRGARRRRNATAGTTWRVAA